MKKILGTVLTVILLVLLALILLLLGYQSCVRRGEDPGPTAEPTAGPTAAPTARPTAEPTPRPTPEPTAVPLIPPGQIDLFNTPMSADDALEAAKELSVVVMENSRVTSGKETWNRFFEMTEAGESAAVLLAHYYTLDPEHMEPEAYEREKANYPKLFFELLTYDSETYRYVVRDCRTCVQDSGGRFSYLNHYAREYSEHAGYDRYVLVNDPNVTWEQCEASMVSSSLFDAVAFHAVYTDIYDND